jgi:hypothetical protein
MTDEAVRLLLVAGTLAAAVLVALVVNRLRKPPHPPLAVQDEGDRPGVVLFTALECSRCKETIAILRSMGVQFREITHELEPQRFEQWRVLAVPLTVILDEDGVVVDAIPGVPSQRRLAGALRSASLEVPL